MGNRKEIDAIGKRILNYVRSELFLSMHFMGPALSSLDYVMDLSTKTVGTDAVYIRFNPTYLMTVWLEHPYILDRTYMHMLMHCLFRHMFGAKQHDDVELWDLCTDIAAESVVDSMDYDVINCVPSDYREACYARLTEAVHVLTAEKLYRWFISNPRDYVEEDRMAAEFWRDDHSFWERIPGNDRKNQDDEKPPLDMPDPLIFGKADENWKKNSKRLLAELSGKKASDDVGGLSRLLAVENVKKTDYREFLRDFSVLREEAAVDPDSFDYGYYNLGMQMYGNMPLMEENEYRISRKVEDLVIVIDTSASCQDTLVQKFLNETAAVLSRGESFFHRVEIHVIECDEQVERDVTIHDIEEMHRFADGFHIRGGGGTDFRPAFAYVENMQRKGTLVNLKGLMYFTDGYGKYPEKMPPYKTAFVFCEDDDYDDTKVPDWAIKLYVGGQDDEHT
ncbi:MAG: VWA-like domain-containing protein [Eubacteriales bacterium]|jgi:predicted metal-dependent peptidase